MVQNMTVLLASRELDLLRAATFALECRGFTVMPVMRAPEVVNHVSENGVDIVVLDVALSLSATPTIVQQVKDDPRFAGTALILLANSRAQLRTACPDREVFNKADDVLVEMFDESDLIDKVKSATRRLRIEKSRYHSRDPEWKDPYAASSFEERREEERFRVEVPVIIRGRDQLGEPFEEETLMVNVSGGGAYLKSEYHIEENTGLEISVRNPHAADGALELRSTVVRAEHGNDRHEPKRRRVAVRFNDDVQQSMEFHLALAKMSGLAYSRGVD